MTTMISIPKRKKLTPNARLALGALSLAGFLGGWNVIGRVENQAAQADVLPTSTASPPPTAAPTRWPTIIPLSDAPPIPTLRPTLTTATIPLPDASLSGSKLDLPTFDLAPLPTLAPMPTLAPLPEMPAPPPPPPPAPSSPGRRSGGS